jgi:hypothetical protein
MTGSSPSQLETEVAALLDLLNGAITDPTLRQQIADRVEAIRNLTGLRFPNLERGRVGPIGIW